MEANVEGSFSSQTSGLSTNYDVFLNFTGKSTRDDFAVFVQKDLKRKGFEVFIDSQRFWDGEEMQPALPKIIQGSRISITVFSSSYAYSRRCLLELEEIVRCNKFNAQKVLPVFLDVEPRDVRNQRGSFGESFQEHQKLLGLCKMLLLGDALRMVGDEEGFELQQVNGDLPSLVELVVDWSSRQLNRQILWNYDVFVSFSGETTSKDFAVLLQKDLKRKGFKVFIEREDLWDGEQIPPTLLKIIQGSRISIPVFCSDYVDSRRCLLELEEIVHRNKFYLQKVRPVFLDVEPTDVRNQTGSFGESFQKHEKQLGLCKMLSLVDALRMVGDEEGVELKQSNGDLPRLVDLVVNWASGQLNRQILWNYDVFISFSGETTSKDFVVLLQNDLKRKGLEVFTYSKDLWNGEEIPPTLLKIIHGSRISIPVFCRDYKDSKRCRLELEEIVLCKKFYGRKFLPVFLNVEPQEFTRSMEKFGYIETIDRRRSLSFVGELRTVVNEMAVKLGQVNGDLSRLVELVVDWSSRQLNMQILLKYDIFLSFRGKTIRNNFASFLQKDLKRKGIEVFIDSEDLWGGEEIQPTLLEIIRGSTISIPVFSSNYADGKCCLLELEEIVRCNGSNGQKVVPIFLDVKPRDVRNQTGSFGEPFQKHLEVFDAQKIQAWKDTLRMVVEKKGVELQQVNGDLARLVEFVANWASRQLNKKTLLNYDVFISFRGADTRNNFTAFLHKDLKRVGLNVFMDEEGLWVGGNIQNVLLDAIRRSKMSIVVLSKNYAHSKWCLQELVEIVRCRRSDGQILFPIFHDVSPRDVRHQTGTFGRSFRHYEENFDFQTVESWKNALREVGSLSGFVSKEADGNHAKLMDEIVYEVLWRLKSLE